MIAWYNSSNIYYFSFFNITINGYIYSFNIYHIGCSLDYHSYLGKLVLELQVNRSVVACVVCRGPQHIHQAVILAAEVQCAIRSGIPGSDFGSLGVLPIEGSTGSPCAAIVSISGCFTIETNGNGITVMASSGCHTLPLPSGFSVTRVHGSSLLSAMMLTLPICKGYSPSGRVLPCSASSSCVQAVNRIAVVRHIVVNNLFFLISPSFL